jgi:hypothetical protein
MADQTKQKAVYAFLNEYARSGATFTTNDLNAKMGWKVSPPVPEGPSFAGIAGARVSGQL